MDKKYLFFVIILIIIIGVAGFIIYNKSQENNSNNNSDNNSTNTSRLATETNTQNTNTQNNQAENTQAETKHTEIEIYSYSSPLKSKAAGRLNNIRITCSALNGTVFSKGETFSFCNTLGPSTAEKGYEKADVIVDGKTIQALGGGNCQVSSTLYNAVLAIPELEVVERHEHGKDVSYVPDGKDAAVSYGSVDFKFKNNYSTDIKMYFSSDDENVTVRLVKLI